MTELVNVDTPYRNCGKIYISFPVENINLVFYEPFDITHSEWKKFVCRII